MKKLTAKTTIVVLILLSAFFPQFNSLGKGVVLQPPEPTWVIWETAAPIQRVEWDGSSVWAGVYNGGLSQWQVETGQMATYTTANGLSGNHVTGIAVDSSGKKWLALLDGSVNTLNGASFVNLTPAGDIVNYL